MWSATVLVFLCNKEEPVYLGIQGKLVFIISGRTGIRTLGSRKGTTVFETAPIDHSGILPLVLLYCRFLF